MRKILTLFIFATSLTFNAQEKLDKAIEILEKNYSQEKVYLLTDKEQYVAGDHIWFKSFVFDGYHKSAISTTLFVELYDRDKKLLDSKTVLLTDAEGSGSLKLKEDLSENVYYLRAYTPWMTNFSQEFDFIKPLAVYNPSSDQKLEPLNDGTWTATLHPEGNTFIENTPTTFSVRVSSAGNPPKDWSGYLIEAGKPNEKITSFKGLDQNVALFQITPKSNTKYQVVIEDKGGVKKEIDLPAAASSGISLQVKNANGGINYSLAAKNLPQGLLNYKVIGTISNKMVYRANIKKPTEQISVTIPSKVSGDKSSVLQLTIFDDKDIPVAQRLFFIKANEASAGKLSLQNPVIDTNPRAMSGFGISNASSTPFTVLVKDAGLSENNRKDENNILSTVWLTGDFSSKIYSPAQYFSKNANAEALDALLISEKWSRFDWNSLLAGTVPSIKTNPGKYLSYEGKLALNSRPLLNKTVNLMFKTEESEIALAQTQTDDKGNIYLNNIFVNEPLKVTYFLNADKKGESVPHNLTLKFQPLVKPTPYKGQWPQDSYRLAQKTAASQILPETAKAVINQKNQKQLNDDAVLIEEVQLRAQKQNASKKLEKELSSGMFNSINSTVFDFVNENQNAFSSGSILDWLQGRVSGLLIQRDNMGNDVPYLRGGPAKIFLDELPGDVGMITALPISSIAMIKVIKGASVVGNAILVYTRRGNMGSQNDTEPSKNNQIVLTGYDKSDGYELVNLSKDVQNKLTNDTREVLYWNPAFLPETNATKVQFLNNDTAKTFRLQVLGFDEAENILYYDEVLP